VIPSDDNEGLTMTVAELASWLKIGKNQAYRAVKEKQVPAVRVGRRLLIPRAALNRWLGCGISAKHRVAPSWPARPDNLDYEIIWEKT
jgi:excisionase family DNA binding protein